MEILLRSTMEKKVTTKYAGKHEPLYVSPTDPERTPSIQNIHLGICETVIWGREFCHFQHSFHLSEMELNYSWKNASKGTSASPCCTSVFSHCMCLVFWINNRHSKLSLFHTRLHSSPVLFCLPYYSMCACNLRQCKMPLGHRHQS